MSLRLARVLRLQHPLRLHGCRLTVDDEVRLNQVAAVDQGGDAASELRQRDRHTLAERVVGQFDRLPRHRVGIPPGAGRLPGDVGTGPPGHARPSPTGRRACARPLCVSPGASIRASLDATTLRDSAIWSFTVLRPLLPWSAFWTSSSPELQHHLVADLRVGGDLALAQRGGDGEDLHHRAGLVLVAEDTIAQSGDILVGDFRETVGVVARHRRCGQDGSGRAGP